MTRLYAIAAAATIVALLSGIWFATMRQPGDMFAECRRGQVAGGTGSIGGPFTLVDHTGQTVTEADAITKPTLLYFGYTYCPDVCPADTARNASAADLLERDGYIVTPAMISIDPERDTPEVMADFVANLHERMIGLTGTMEQVRAAAKEYRVYFKRQDGDPEFYLVDHSAFSYLVLPDAGVVEYYGRDVTPRGIADSAACFISATGQGGV